jgi:hypothetical protein
MRGSTVPVSVLRVLCEILISPIELKGLNPLEASTTVVSNLAVVGWGAEGAPQPIIFHLPGFPVPPLLLAGFSSSGVRDSYEARTAIIQYS